MGDKTGIEWTDSTWNPVRGCTRVSEGCRHCYAETVAARFSGSGQPYEGLAHRVGGEARWTSVVRALTGETLTQPLRWKKPRRIFVNSMSDLFHESLPDEAIDRVFAVMALAPRHVFQVLTKRPARMQAYLRRLSASINPLEDCARALGYTFKFKNLSLLPWPITNIWVGVSVEDQKTADERIPPLLDTPASVRFLSCEPLLGPLDLTNFLSGLNWVIAGGESGHGARPMHPDWARSLRDQCTDASVPFFFKQWGEHWPAEFVRFGTSGEVWRRQADGSEAWAIREIGNADPDPIVFQRVGKKAAGATLDGRQHRELPE